MMMFMLVLFFQMVKGLFNGISSLHGCQNLLSVQIIPVSSYNYSMFVMLAKELNYLFQLFLVHTGSMAENDRAGVFHLIVIELAEVFHIYLCFLCIHNCSKSVKLYMVKVQILHSLNNIAQLAYTRRFDENSVRMELVKHLFQSLSEITYQAAADAS